ncbi:6-phospho-5-dehydro-2-deoxy-D-gluconate aldolase [Gracilibacillus orientalis]|uniref:6-phospho-5-dehydro-2-deoxy-D-gluconate aldolase n=1 Tax=Gracilibacillus orientalis TaxID=334253 RepID=A0A1I4GUB8_9BACI|nr:class II fructose-1,6-bisphosphate aldolase [Gracilibacillus orientalis]SFL33565.1 6-phospho-5-dehydro-2-deoxy-D-gluconate aldolase [Gracilibacillus orientalis]
MLVSMKDMIVEAKKNHYAVGQFNINSFQWVTAILQAAEKERSPVIIASTDRIVDYLGGLKLIASTTRTIVEEMQITVPVALHLDHGFTVEQCKRAIDAGYSSVMIDGSKYPIEENIKMTQEVVEYARKFGVSVEAEIGSVGGTEDGVVGGIKYADPSECFRIVEETKVDALAAALGSVHGEYKGEPKFAFDLMKEISEGIDIPLALHGGSGIPDHQIIQAIEYGHAKINVNTESNKTWAETVRNILTNDTKLFSPPDILGPGMDAITQVVQEKMRLFGSANRV